MLTIIYKKQQLFITHKDEATISIDAYREETEQMKKLLWMANSQLGFIGCFANCNEGTMDDGSQCQCCDEQEQIRKFLNHP